MLSNQPMRRSLFLLVAGLAFFALAASEPQCARIGDRVAGPNGSTPDVKGGNGVAECVQACVSAAQDARAAENDIHNANLESCAGDPECLAEESARHAAVMQQIAMDQQDCKAPCHNQGGGHGGQ